MKQRAGRASRPVAAPDLLSIPTSVEEGPAKWNFEGWPGHTVKKRWNMMSWALPGGEVSRVVLLALLEDALLAWVMVGEVGVGDGWMVTPAPCRTAASLPFMAGLKWLLNTREDTLPALLSTGLSETAAQQGSQ